VAPGVQIFDTAGRQEIDEALMDELKALKEFLQPHEILLVADAATGQQAVSIASGFDAALSITGIILTKLDGDARGGAALSMREVTHRPIKFAGTGEKLDQFELFIPERLAGRILGMGDVVVSSKKLLKPSKPKTLPGLSANSGPLHSISMISWRSSR
jgi:Signal recognition particle GTPase